MALTCLHCHDLLLIGLSVAEKVQETLVLAEQQRPDPQ